MKPLRQHVELGAMFNFTVFNADGTVKTKSGDSPNIVLNQGLDRMGTANYISAVAVGSGNSEPVATQTGLDAQVAYTSSTQGTFDLTYEATPVPRYVLKMRFRFNAGAFNNDNLSEVSIGWTTGSTFYAWNRALIKDAAGLPTTLTLLSDEYLDVSIFVYYYPPLTDSVQTIQMLDGAGVFIRDMTITTRSANLGQFTPPTKYASAWASPYLQGKVRVAIQENNWMTLHDADIAIITALPGGTRLASTSYGSSDLVAVSQKEYVAGSYKVEGSFTIKLNGGNGTIRSMVVKTSLGAYQSEFEPPIVKNNTQVLTIPVVLSWGRYEGGA